MSWWSDLPTTPAVRIEERIANETRAASKTEHEIHRWAIANGTCSREVHFDTLPPYTGGGAVIACGAVTTRDRIEQSTRVRSAVTCPRCKAVTS